MRCRATLVAAIASILVTAGFSSMAAEMNPDGGLPILVRVCVSAEFKNQFKKTSSYNVNSTNNYRGKSYYWSYLTTEEIREKVTDALQKKLAAYDPGGILKPVFCKTDDELREKFNKRQGYMCLNIVLKKRKWLDTGYKLFANVELSRLEGGGWKQLIKKAVESSYDRKKGISDMSLLVETVDAIMRKNIVAFEVIRSVSRNSRTKAIHILVGNTTNFDVTMIKWLVPDSKTVLSAKTEGRLKPGAVVEIDIVMQSEGSHSSIQWRDVTIGGIRFAQPGK